MSVTEGPVCAAADEHSAGTSGDEEGGGLVMLRGRLASLGSDPSSSHSRQHGSAGAGPARSADARHISSALLQHASEQLHRHLDRGASGHFSSEQPSVAVLRIALHCGLYLFSGFFVVYASLGLPGVLHI